MRPLANEGSSVWVNKGTSHSSSFIHSKQESVYTLCSERRNVDFLLLAYFLKRMMLRHSSRPALNAMKTSGHVLIRDFLLIWRLLFRHLLGICLLFEGMEGL